jgi:hypothetical protein
MRPIFVALLLAVPAAFTGACSGNPLGTAQIENVVDTVVLSALVGTPITRPSAYSVSSNQAVRTDQTSAFDFAYNVLPDGRHVFLPLATLGLTSTTAEPGFLPTNDAFGDITDAPLNGYLTIDTLDAIPDLRYVLRGRIVCTTLGVPNYGKLHVLSVDDADRTVTFEVLANRNCGFRSLRAGIPTD